MCVFLTPDPPGIIGDFPRYNEKYYEFRPLSAQQVERYGLDPHTAAFYKAEVGLVDFH